MKILVTGNRGFIGQNLVRYFQARGHELSTFEWGETLPEIKGLDWVIHLGAISSTTERNVDLVMTQNYDFSRRLLDLCQQHEVNFQYSSSASVYGLNKDFKETSPVDPRSPYAWSKYLFDRHVTELLSQSNSKIRIQGFRYFNVYGPGEDHKRDQASPFYKFRQQAMKSGVIQLFYGSHHYFRDFVPVERVVELHHEFLDVQESGIWNIGTGQVRSFLNVAEEIAKEHSAVIKYVDMPEAIRLQYQYYTCADLTKLSRTLNEKSCG